MLSKTLVVISVLSTALAAPTTLSPRGDHPDEVVVLASCDNGKSGVQLEVKDRLHYFSDDYARRKGGASQDTVLQIHDPATHDGFTYHVSWDAGTIADPVSATFPDDGRIFKVWGLPSTGESSKADEPVEGTATLGGASFKCYKGDSSQTWSTGDGFTCAAAFTCTRLERWIRKTNVNFDDKTVLVGEPECHVEKSTAINAKDAFGKLKDAVSKSWDTETGFDIGAGCKMYFPVVTVPPASNNYDDTTPQQIVDIFVDHIGAEVEKNRTSKGRNCNRPGYMGQDTTYHIEEEQLEYPRGGQFEIFVAQQSNPQWVTQTRVDFRVACACHDNHVFLSALANGLGLFGGWISPAFGTASASINIMSLALGQC
ncbi:uncharacterized protein BDR25DRAFT_383791 [Lindgomyces ingoldianus]|uniref:Uncharacterized protein n=1 Tax=Lindgomyces ingoldianus TaxID=673940 RepID=A0ACB6R5C9_9PLEO|nr:uncharacterized protein BDR25DRAFT_383791 [Lindgomyces ingoldianus]KAF2474478.1 hypothetical protein BDR25DRAFT_383791 [Lindgomyces ingoldianus]